MTPFTPPHLEHNWYNVTTWADRDWKAAQTRYYDELCKVDGYSKYEARRRSAHAGLMIARANYRRRVLSWYWKLCTPMQTDECVPNMVAELLAEEWDLRTREHPAVRT